MSRMLRRLGPLGAAVLSILACATPASAGGLEPIGPDQYYVGVVNGHFGQSVIAVDCVGQTGHPLPHQSITAQRIPAPDGPKPNVSAGFTGSAVPKTTTWIGAGLDGSTSPFIDLEYYGQPAEIPITLSLPCETTGTIGFMTLRRTDQEQAGNIIVPDAVPATVSVKILSTPLIP
jgi:hypothetical protein